MRERWRQVRDFPDYAISDQGRVRRGGSKGYIVSHSYAGQGRYCRVAMMRDGRGHCRYVHRLVALAFVSNQSGKPEVNHDDGNKDNNVFTNLVWATHAENQQHSVHVLGNIPTHLHKHGENHPMARLSSRDVRVILSRLSKGDTQVSIARDYEITQVMVSRIKLGKAWRHIKRP